MTHEAPLPLDNVTDDPETSFTLPSPWYYLPQAFELEKERIFYRSWRFVCHTSEVSRPGAFVCTEIVGQDVFVIRSQDGQLRAFHNVCQHRAHVLLEGRGTVKAVITCPYHAWAYGTDGTLRAARMCERVKGFDKRDFGLSSIRVQAFAGFVFVNLDPDAPTIEEVAPGLDEEIRRWLPDLERVQFAQRRDFDIAANWKVVVENASEGYHFPSSGPHHRELADLVDMAATKLLVRDKWIAIIAPPGSSPPPLYPFPTHGHSGQTDHLVTFYLWPDWVVYALPHANMIATFFMRPTGPESTVVENAYYEVPGASGDATTVGAGAWFNDALGPEDASLNAGVQRGIRSRGYRQGRFVTAPGEPGDSEHGVHAFQKWVRQAVAD